MARTKLSQEKKRRAQQRQDILPYAPEALDEETDGEKIGRDHFGRPTVMTKQTLLKLEAAFKFGCTDREACIYAEIATSTFYLWLKTHEYFSERKEELKEAPIVASRAVVFDAILKKGSVADAWAMLRAKRKEEFSELKKTQVEFKNPLTADDMEAIARGEVNEIVAPDADDEADEQEEPAEASEE